MRIYRIFTTLILMILAVSSECFCEPSLTRKESLVIAQAIDVQKNDPKKAREILQEASSKTWAGAAIFFNLANLCYNEGDFISAQKNYKISLQKCPDFFRARKNLGYTLLKTGDEAEAYKYLREALALCGGSDVDILLSFAAKNIRQRNFSSALAFCKQALIYEPENTAILRAKMSSLCELQRWSSAREIAEKFAEKNPKDAEARKVIARAKLGEGNELGALSEIEKLRLLELSDARLDILAARLYLKNYAFLKAFEILENLPSSKERDALLLELAKFALSRGEFGIAQKISKKVEENSLTKEADILYTISLAKNSSFEKARAFLADFCLKNPDEIRAKLEFASVCFDMQDYVASAQAYSECLADKSSEKTALIGLMNSKIALGDYRSAVSTAKILKEKFPSAEINLYLKNLEDSLRNENVEK